MRNLAHSEFYVNFYEIHETKHSVYMILDYIKGGELTNITKMKKKHTEEECRSFVKNLLTGLSQIHSKGIMHRDLKPQNIIMRSKKDIKDIVIIDFGLASFVDVDQYLYERCGTPGFVAPEIFAYKSN